MLISGRRRSSQIATCLAAAGDFHLPQTKAIAIVSQQIETINTYFRPLCDEANVGPVDRKLLWGRQFLNPFAFFGLDGPAAAIAERATAIRAAIL